ncbi:MAG: TetR family transcriptional regulator [Micrococcales bacterium]|nr:MAG: TetR family transcriptional regulator [Micrococcales bacterium]
MSQTNTSSDPARLPRSARRAQLLVAAQEVFASCGFHSASMEDIGTRAGVSKPVLYQHFSSKLELYLAVLDDLSADLLCTVESALHGPTTDGKSRLTRTVHAYFEFVDRAERPYRLLFESDLIHEPQVAQRVDRLARLVASMVGDVIAGETGLGESESMMLGVALAGMAQVTARHWINSGRPIPREAAADLVDALSWRGIRSFPAAESSEEDGPLARAQGPGPAPAAAVAVGELAADHSASP